MSGYTIEQAVNRAQEATADMSLLCRGKYNHAWYKNERCENCEAPETISRLRRLIKNLQKKKNDRKSYLQANEKRLSIN